jgi:hypothetical protein
VGVGRLKRALGKMQGARLKVSEHTRAPIYESIDPTLEASRIVTRIVIRLFSSSELSIST